MPGQPRDLTFHNFGEVRSEVESLLRLGYKPVGKWDLAQVCNHLADWLTFPVAGFPKAPLPIRIVLWALSKTIAPGQFRKMLETGKMRAGTPTMPETVSASGGDVVKAVDRLMKALDRFEAHEGPYHPSPLFGSVDRETACRLQLIHAAHHLSFLIPVIDGQTA